MTILFRRGREQPRDPAHQIIHVFIGPAPGSLKLSGELVMSEDEWQVLSERLKHGTAADNDMFIVEDRFGSPVG